MKLTILLLLAPLLAAAQPRVIDDRKLVKSFESGVGAFADQEGVPSANDLAKAAKEAAANGSDVEISCSPVGDNDYEALSESVFMLGSVYKCDKCDDWHAGGVATAWCVSSDGLMVSNAHVFEKAKGAAMGICDRDGNCYPVIQLVASDSSADVALFRVKGEGFRAVPLGKPAGIGTGVRVISHPDRRYFMQTGGEVSRYYHRPANKGKKAGLWMSITADYAKGSSGGPLFNDAGEVVGMVSSTQTIYYNSNDGTPKGPVQMVVKNCVPVSAIRALIEE